MRSMGRFCAPRCAPATGTETVGPVPLGPGPGTLDGPAFAMGLALGTRRSPWERRW
jgi:hypothetical protein